TLPKATPTITPTARSTTLPFIAKSLKSLSKPIAKPFLKDGRVARPAARHAGRLFGERGELDSAAGFGGIEHGARLIDATLQSRRKRRFHAFELGQRFVGKVELVVLDVRHRLVEHFL